MAVVEFDRFSYAYPGSGLALDDITLDIPKGSFTVITGYMAPARPHWRWLLPVLCLTTLAAAREAVCGLGASIHLKAVWAKLPLKSARCWPTMRAS